MAECSDLDDPFRSANERNADDGDLSLFEAAAAYIQKKVDELDKETLLYLYAYFKQAKEGSCNISKPGFLDFKGREKWTAWKSLGEDMTAEIAMKAYVTKVKEMYPQWIEDTKSNLNARKGNTIGPVMSVPVDTTVHVPDNEKTMFDYVKEADTIKLQENLDKSNVNLKDESKMTLLHWACDRGHLEIVRILLAAGANVNVQDEEGQTPLHYSSSCGHVEVLLELLQNGADKNIVDYDGHFPQDVALNETTKNCFA